MRSLTWAFLLFLVATGDPAPLRAQACAAGPADGQATIVADVFDVPVDTAFAMAHLVLAELGYEFSRIDSAAGVLMTTTDSTKRTLPDSAIGHLDNPGFELAVALAAQDRATRITWAARVICRLDNAWPLDTDSATTLYEVAAAVQLGAHLLAHAQVRRGGRLSSVFPSGLEPPIQVECPHPRAPTAELQNTMRDVVVTLSFIVGVDGTPILGTIEVDDSMDSRYNVAARAVIPHCEFLPGKLAGAPIRMEVRLPIRFLRPDPNTEGSGRD